MNALSKILSLSILIILVSCSIKDKGSTDVNSTNELTKLIDDSYEIMSNYRYMGRNMLVAGEVRSDNVYSNADGTKFSDWSAMDVTASDVNVADLMKGAYSSVVNPNLVLEIDPSTITGSAADNSHLMGEAFLLRAFAHFDLLRIFGQVYSEGNELGISYINRFDPEQKVERGTIESNYANIKMDIADAVHYFELGASSSRAKEKLNFTLDAAYALQSRVGTYFKDYAYAYAGSKEIVDKYSVTPAAAFVDYWSQQTPPAASIMELEQNESSKNQGSRSIGATYRGSSSDLRGIKSLIEDFDFDVDDIRVSADMIKISDQGVITNIGKYPAKEELLGSDNIKVFRIEEIILNHAEALINGAGTGDALEYLNRIPSNRQAATYMEATMDNVLKERRKELLFEGFRFFDLARTGKDIRDMDVPTNNHGLIPSGNYKFAFPIPLEEININNQSEQNPGY